MLVRIEICYKISCKMLMFRLLIFDVRNFTKNIDLLQRLVMYFIFDLEFTTP